MEKTETAKLAPREVEIGGEVYEIKSTYNLDGGGFMLCTDGREEFAVFKSREAAGEAAREHWQDMADHDPKEFTCMVGEETLIAWALGQHAGPGSTSVTSLSDWLDLWLDTPAEHWASYDGHELDLTRLGAEIAAETGFDEGETDGSEEPSEYAITDAVAYRHN